MTTRNPRAAAVIYSLLPDLTWLQSLAVMRIVQEANSGCAVDGVHLTHDLTEL